MELRPLVSEGVETLPPSLFPMMPQLLFAVATQSFLASGLQPNGFIQLRASQTFVGHASQLFKQNVVQVVQGIVFHNFIPLWQLIRAASPLRLNAWLHPRTFSVVAWS